jgi:hypothetical protein
MGAGSDAFESRAEASAYRWGNETNQAGDLEVLRPVDLDAVSDRRSDLDALAAVHCHSIVVLQRLSPHAQSAGRAPFRRSHPTIGLQLSPSSEPAPRTGDPSPVFHLAGTADDGGREVNPAGAELGKSDRLFTSLAQSL